MTRVVLSGWEYRSRFGLVEVFGAEVYGSVTSKLYLYKPLPRVKSDIVGYLSLLNINADFSHTLSGTESFLTSTPITVYFD